MALSPAQFGQQATTFVKSLSARQRITLAGSAVLVAGLIYGFVILMGRSEYQPIYTGLSTDEGVTLVQHLAVRGISAQLTSDGTGLSVPAGDAAKARMDLAAEGLPRSGHLGFEIFDKPNWAGSDFVEQVNYQRALEGELETTIESMDGLEAVRVHLAMAHDSVFTDQQRDAKASVLVRLHPGVRLSDEDLNAITFLVANAVDNMKPEDVRVVNADGHVPLVPQGSDHMPEAEDMETALARKVEDTLGPFVGGNAVRASVTVEFENGSNETTQESYDPTNSAVFSSQMTAEAAAFAAAAQGVPGAASNVPQAQSQPAPSQQAQSQQTPKGQSGAAASVPDSALRSENKTFGVGRTVRHSVSPAGGVRRISAAVVVDDAVDTSLQGGKKVETRRKRTPDEMQQIEGLAKAAIGFDAARGDQLVVQDMSFASNPSDLPSPPTLTQRIPNIVNQWLPLIRYIGLALGFALVYLLILKPLKKQLAATLKQLPASPPARTAPALGQGSSSTPESPHSAGLGPGRAAPVAALKDAVGQRVAQEPLPASRLVQDWVRQR
jgi:flagellar M-ring protein FliF